MWGRIAVVALVATGVLGGAGIYYFQVHAFYEEPAALASVVLTTPEGASEVPVEGTEITRGSSPLSHRACFALAEPPPEPTPFEGAAPPQTPGWFECFDAGAIGADLAAGRAVAALGSEARYGVDRVLALYPDGRGYAWNQLNACGAAVYAGRPAPEGCPPPPQAYRD